MPTWSCRCIRDDSKASVLAAVNTAVNTLEGAGMSKRWSACNYSARLQVTASHACLEEQSTEKKRTDAAGRGCAQAPGRGRTQERA